MAHKSSVRRLPSIDLKKFQQICRAKGRFWTLVPDYFLIQVTIESAIDLDGLSVYLSRSEEMFFLSGLLIRLRNQKLVVKSADTSMLLRTEVHLSIFYWFWLTILYKLWRCRLYIFLAPVNPYYKDWGAEDNINSCNRVRHHGAEPQ